MESGFSETVQVEFSLAVGAGRLDASVDVPAGDVTLTQILPVIQNLTSNLVGSAVEQVNREGYQISCKAGCGACCRQLVPLSIFEAEWMAEWIRSLPTEQQAALEARFHAALIQLRERGMLERITSAKLEQDEVEKQQLSADYLKAWVACPFLVNESCSIHPIRPLICREYLVTSPAEYCKAPGELPVVGVPMPVRPSKALFYMGAELENNPYGWIPLVFLFAWMKSGAKPGDSIAGPGPEVLFRFVEELAKVGNLGELEDGGPLG